MDKRNIFVLVFFITLFTTILVAVACVLAKHSWMMTAIYTLASMWIVGIVSQLLLNHLYMSIVKPIEDAQNVQERLDAVDHGIDLEEVEEIDPTLNQFHSKFSSQTAEEEEAGEKQETATAASGTED